MGRAVLFVANCLIFVLYLNYVYGQKARKVLPIKNSTIETQVGDELYEVKAAAPSPDPNDCSECWCQCKRLSFRDQYGRVHGNCQR